MNWCSCPRLPDRLEHYQPVTKCETVLQLKNAAKQLHYDSGGNLGTTQKKNKNMLLHSNWLRNGNMTPVAAEMFFFFLLPTHHFISFLLSLCSHSSSHLLPLPRVMLMVPKWRRCCFNLHSDVDKSVLKDVAGRSSPSKCFYDYDYD